MKKVLLVLAGVLLIFSAEAKAVVELPPESLYVWKYEGGCLTLNYEYLQQPNNFFYIADKNDTQSILLFGNNQVYETFNISKNDDTYSASVGTGTVTSIALGLEPEFTFKFSADGTTFYKLYSYTDFGPNNFTLQNSTTGMTVGLACPINPLYSLTVNEVPVPGAAFLLGSGLLGLIGIRSRRQ